MALRRVKSGGRQRGEGFAGGIVLATLLCLALLVHLLDQPRRFHQAAAAGSIADVVAIPALKPVQGPPAPARTFPADLLPPEPAEERLTAGFEPPPAPPADDRLFLAETPVAVPFAADAPRIAALPLWQRNAVPAQVAPGQPRIAIVIDDLGPRRAATRSAIALPGPLTLSFLPYAEGVPALVAEARAVGHELLVHVPMEPLDLAHNNPGPQALLTRLDAAELRARLDWSLARFDGYVGINNHMGSAFTRDGAGLRVVMDELHRRGLLFLDSRTVGGSLAEAMALEEGVPALGRDVFLDNDADDPAAIWAQLRLVERIARERGQAVAIGHPHPATLAVLAQWLPQVQAAGFALVPISALVSAPTSDQLVSVEP